MSNAASPGSTDRAIEEGWKKQIMKVIAHVDLDAFYSQVPCYSSFGFPKATSTAELREQYCFNLVASKIQIVQCFHQIMKQ